LALRPSQDAIEYAVNRTRRRALPHLSTRHRAAVPASDEKEGGRMTDLFTHAERYPQVAGYKAEGTSREAAESIDAKGLRAIVLREITRCPGTPDEIAARLGLSVLSTRPRCSELAALNLIEDSGERRFNASGRRATVFRARAA
jgi:hypothetical protein